MAFNYFLGVVVVGLSTGAGVSIYTTYRDKRIAANFTERVKRGPERTTRLEKPTAEQMLVWSDIDHKMHAWHQEEAKNHEDYWNQLED